MNKLENYWWNDNEINDWKFGMNSRRWAGCRCSINSFISFHFSSLEWAEWRNEENWRALRHQGKQKKWNFFGLFAAESWMGWNELLFSLWGVMAGLPAMLRKERENKSNSLIPIQQRKQNSEWRRECSWAAKPDNQRPSRNDKPSGSAASTNKFNSTFLSPAEARRKVNEFDWLLFASFSLPAHAFTSSINNQNIFELLIGFRSGKKNKQSLFHFLHSFKRMEWKEIGFSFFNQSIPAPQWKSWLLLSFLFLSLFDS